MKTHTQQFLQKRKLIMALPALTMPFLTMIFWALGGGTATPGQAVAMNTAGLSLELPSAHFSPDEKTDKFSLYEAAQRDSAEFLEAVENDPYFDLNTMVLEEKENEPLSTTNTTTFNPGFGAMDPNEVKVNEKLELLYKELNRVETVPVSHAPGSREVSMVPPVDHEEFSEDVSKLEAMMEMMNRSEEPDPEMAEMQTVLDKILDIQHPERVKERIQEEDAQKKIEALPVTIDTGNEFIGTLVESTGPGLDTVFAVSAITQNDFFGLVEESQETQSDNAIPAVLHNTQQLVAGSTVKLRLVADIYINGHRIPKDHFIFGTADISEERLTISITSLRFENSLFPVSLSAYDLDGMEGLYIPGAIARDAAKQSSDQALQGMQLYSMDGNIGAQAAGVGVEAAKSLFSKKVKLIQVTVKAGYQVLLKDTNTQNL